MTLMVVTATTAAKSAVAAVSVAVWAENSDLYPHIVARLNDQWRVIVCRDGIQWILQAQSGHSAGLPRWRSRYFCRTREGLLRCVREHAGPIGRNALAVLSRLPKRIGGAS